MLGKLLGNKAKEAANKFKGNTDYLEAVCALNALVAAGKDGNISDDEVDGMLKTARANKTLTAAFSEQQIVRCAEEMLKRAQGGRMGRAGLWTEVEDIKNDPDMCEAVILGAIDVAESDGEMDADEEAIIRKAGDKLSVNVDALLDV